MIILNISEIAIITKDNLYSNFNKYLIKFWEKNNKSDYHKYVKLT